MSIAVCGHSQTQRQSISRAGTRETAEKVSQHSGVTCLLCFTCSSTTAAFSELL